MDTKDNNRKRRSSPPGARKTPAATTRKAAAKPASRKAPPARRSAAPAKPEPPKPAEEVVYLPPQPFNRNRFVLRLLTVVAVVIALLLGVSVFFKIDIEKVQVSGVDKYTAWDVLQASGIEDGDHLLTFSRAGASGKIIGALPYVEKARFGIKLPDTLMIEIVEVQVAYAVQAEDESWWLISSGGKVVERLPSGAHTLHTQLLGVVLKAPTSGQRAQALEKQSVNTDEEGNPIPVTTTEEQRLKTGLDILEYLEMNGIIGTAASVNVADLGSLEIWYGNQYQVKLGDTTQLSYKIGCMKSAIDALDSYQSGVLDITFTILPDKVGYTPFDAVQD